MSCAICGIIEIEGFREINYCCTSVNGCISQRFQMLLTSNENKKHLERRCLHLLIFICTVEFHDDWQPFIWPIVHNGFTTQTQNNIQDHSCCYIDLNVKRCNQAVTPFKIHKSRSYLLEMCHIEALYYTVFNVSIMRVASVNTVIRIHKCKGIHGSPVEIDMSVVLECHFHAIWYTKNCNINTELSVDDNANWYPVPHCTNLQGIRTDQSIRRALIRTIRCTLHFSHTPDSINQTVVDVAFYLIEACLHSLFHENRPSFGWHNSCKISHIPFQRKRSLCEVNIETAIYCQHSKYVLCMMHFRGYIIFSCHDVNTFHFFNSRDCVG